MDQIKKAWENKPLTLIVWIAIILRLIAAIFSKGFGMHDDHFLVIEAAQSWVDGYDYNNWLPKNADTPSGHSFFYVGIHYLVFWFLNWTGMEDAQAKMYVIRILHAFYSLITVVIGYKIANKLHSIKAARITGLLLAAYWFMPFLSVRNLVEVVCIPMMIYGTWLIIKSEDKKHVLMYVFWAGFMLGLAFSTRFQTLIFTGGLGLALLIKTKWKETLIFALGFLVSIFLIQGMIDFFVWGYPFAELSEYIRYNMEHAYDYNVIAWYSFILLVLGILLPPVSLFMGFGFFRKWKKHIVIFLPTILFFIFHSAFPNKQERFILPAVPFIIVLGMIGWMDFVEKSKFWKNHRRLLRASWIFFWVLNIILLPAITTMYSKRARVESMTYLSSYENIGHIARENTNKGNAKMSPRFYLEEWVYESEVSQSQPLTEERYKNDPPSFVLFFEDEKLEQRVENFKEAVPGLVYETTIQPGFVDKVMHWLNPNNANEVIYIYRNTKKFPEPSPKFQ
ncbi:MAG: glycosyltransferase family 39 protein [Bacteroidales bacterium]|nr:glycosyltransferase family 39 protein [Bacteroidales bacterium]MCF8344534.1 glycosyltransferase family 39 protein [Bacteroidales bacterium]MCF8377813.1 glycosyltransferase family 39 protein [Bacteroidales bacterium]